MFYTFTNRVFCTEINFDVFLPVSANMHDMLSYDVPLLLLRCLYVTCYLSACDLNDLSRGSFRLC